MAKHLIYKQKVTLRLSRKEEAYAFQDRVSRLMQNDLKDSLEKILDNAFPPDKIVRINTLQLNLGSISRQNFEPEFKARFIEALTKSLSEKHDSTGNSADREESVLSKAQSLESALIFFLERGYLPWYSSARKTAGWEDELLNDLSESEYHHFSNWLKGKHYENQVVTERLISQFSDKFIGGLLKKMNLAFDEPWGDIFADYAFILSNIFNYITTAGEEKWGRTGAFLNESKNDQPELDKTNIRTQIWRSAFHVLLNAKDSDAALRILKRLIVHFGIKGNVVNRSKQQYLNEGIKTGTVKQALTKLVAFLKSTEVGVKDDKNSPAHNKKTGKNKNDDIVAEDISSPNKTQNESDKADNDSDETDRISAESKIRNKNDGADKGVDETNDISAENETGNKNSSGGTIIGNSKDALSKNESNGTKGEADNPAQNKNEDIYSTAKNPINKLLKKAVSQKRLPDEGELMEVNNCGVVILHPFLKPYFERLGLVSDGMFTNDLARGRAVLLLNYLATGLAEAPEFELTLQKILCGYPLEDTLPASIILTDKEKTESDNLLLSVIDYWPPLKNTSADGFRNTFLQRNGNLEAKESGWLLKVEQKAFDILFGKLPWGFSTIRLSWMQNMLSVDWY
jgi:hypothetical protein